MKSKCLSKIAVVLLACASHAIAGEFRWAGENSLFVAGKPNAPVLVDEGPGVRKTGSLLFENEGNPGGKAGAAAAKLVRVTSLPLENMSSELTIACFVKPGRKKANEDLIASKSDSRTDWEGYRLFKVWDSWGVEVGNGVTGSKIYAKDKLTLGAWQHLAVVIKDGAVTFYRDGLLVSDGRLEIQSVAIPSSVGIGAGPRGYLPFHGLITGIYLSDKALDEEGIVNHMRSVTE